jgi:hypothetical protein
MADSISLLKAEGLRYTRTSIENFFCSPTMGLLPHPMGALCSSRHLLADQGDPSICDESCALLVSP